jgi:hypothetical protein
MIARAGNEIFPQPIATSLFFAQRVNQNLDRSPFRGILRPDVVLVPVPRSSLSKPGSLWPAEKIAMALRQVGLGASVLPLLKRAKPVEPSSRGGERIAKLHYESMKIALPIPRDLFAPRMRIVLVDDIVTSGATLLGAASRLAAAFGSAEIKGFAAVRTMSSPASFHGLRDPVLGKITLRDNGSCSRVP